jgi:hypothetical protein
MRRAWASEAQERVAAGERCQRTAMRTCWGDAGAELAQRGRGAGGGGVSARCRPRSSPWPEGVALQVHIVEHDPFEASHSAELVAAVPGELFVTGVGALFTDSSWTGTTRRRRSRPPRTLGLSAASLRSAPHDPPDGNHKFGGLKKHRRRNSTARCVNVENIQRPPGDWAESQSVDNAHGANWRSCTVAEHLTNKQQLQALCIVEASWSICPTSQLAWILKGRSSALSQSRSHPLYTRPPRTGAGEIECHRRFAASHHLLFTSHRS